jgi:hypothetical protein
LLWAIVVLAGGPGSSGDVALGRVLFSGARPLAAHVAGQDWDLPQDAVACTNCHQRGSSPGPSAAVGPDVSFGPPLTRTTLTRALGRRGGPPSVYDGARLCRAMRDGIDPAWVVIPQTMPRYAFTDGECRALWAFLLTSS